MVDTIKVAIPATSLYITPPNGTRFFRMLHDGRHVIGFEYPKGREKEIIEYFNNHLTSMAAMFIDTKAPESESGENGT